MVPQRPSHHPPHARGAGPKRRRKKHAERHGLIVDDHSIIVYGCLWCWSLTIHHIVDMLWIFTSVVDRLSSLSINDSLRIPQRRALLPGPSVFLISPRMVAIVRDEKRVVLIIWFVFFWCLRDSENFSPGFTTLWLCALKSSVPHGSKDFAGSAAWHSDAEDTSPLLERVPVLKSQLLPVGCPRCPPWAL